MTAQDLEGWIQELLLLQNHDSGSEPYKQLRWVLSYKAAGILTPDAGLVVRMADGTEYQITVVRSR